MKKYDACGRLATMEIFSHGESEAWSDLSTNPHESTRTGIRENPCQSVDKTSAIQSTVGQFSWTYHADASLKAALAYAAG